MIEEITFLEILNVRAVSPSSDFFCRLEEPVEVTMGNWASEIAFFKKPNLLIYHRVGHKAHFDVSASKTNQENRGLYLINWSSDGNHVKFFEYKRNSTYEYVLLDLQKALCYRASNPKSKSYQLLYSLKDLPYKGDDIVKELVKSGVTSEPALEDPLPSQDFWDKMFGWRKWYP